MAIDTLGANALASNSVTTAKIAADAVTSAKIPAGAVVASDVADGSVTTAKLADNAVTSAKALNLGRRNLIINGAMQIAQRGTSSTGIGYQTVDRFAVNQSNFDNLVSTKTQDTNVPVGFSKSLKIATTTAETALAADEYGNMSYAIEAQDLQSLAYGTSSAKSFTLSFYVKSNLTGNFSVTAYKQTGANKQQDRQYTINSADTWERKTLTFAGDTAQSIVNDNTVGMYLYWHTAFGANFGTDTYNASAGWSAYTNAGWGAGHDVNTLFNSTSNYIQFTGIQMEIGDTATDFEHRSFGEEFTLCQRYYCHSYNYGTYPGANTGGSTPLGKLANGHGYDSLAQFQFPVEMRSVPTMTLYNPITGTVNSFRGDSSNYSGAAIHAATTRGVRIYRNATVGATVFTFIHATANAEL